MNTIKNQVHYNNVNQTIDKIKTGLKHLGRDLDPESSFKINSQLNSLRSQKTDLRTEIREYTKE